MSDELTAPDFWEQQPDEPASHFAWFRAFLELGPSRSMIAAYRTFGDRKGQNRTGKQPENVSGAWRRAAEKWQWHDRAAHFDLIESDRVMDEQRTRRNALSARLLDAVEKQVERGETLDNWSERVMKSPRYAKPFTNDDGTFNVQPADWNFGDGIRAAAVAARSNKTAAELLEMLERIDTAEWLRNSQDAQRRLQSGGGVMEPPPAPTPTEERARENMILSVAEDFALAQVVQNVPGAVERLLAIHDRRCRLNGLVKPFDPNAEQPEKRNRDFSNWPPALLALLEAAYERHGDGTGKDPDDTPSSDTEAEI